MQHKPPTSVGIVTGLALIIGLLLLEIGLAVLVLTTPVTPLTVLRVLLGLLILPAVVLVLQGLSALSSASYAADRQGVAIRWGMTRTVIPLSTIDQIVPGHQLGAVKRFRGLFLPGYWSGRGRIEGVGAVQFFCTTPLARQLVITTRQGGAYAVSPENPERFLDLLAAQQALGPAEEAQAEPLPGEPAERPAGFLADHTAHLLLASGAVMSLILFLYLSAQVGRLPTSLPLHYALNGQPDRVGPPGQLFALAWLGLGVWLVNGALGMAVYRRPGERMAAYLLWGAAAGLQVLLGIALAGLVGM